MINPDDFPFLFRAFIGYQIMEHSARVSAPASDVKHFVSWFQEGEEVFGGVGVLSNARRVRSPFVIAKESLAWKKRKGGRTI